MSLEARIHLLPVEDVPEGPDVVVDEPGSTRDVAERLRAPSRADPPSLLARIGTLGSPDRLTVVGAAHEGQRVEVELDVRRFSGPVFANVVSVAVLEVGPVPLAPGRAELVITVHTRSFDTLERPEDAGAAETASSVLPFTA